MGCKIRTVSAALMLSAVALSAAAGAARAEVGAPQIVEGDQGFGVYCVQVAADYFLDDSNYYATPDGSFGPQTLRVVERFQQQNSLVQDGGVGPLTGTRIWGSVQNHISHVEAGGGSVRTPWGVPLTDCCQVLPTTS
ncbi:peptidoglycan-binding protein [Streptomyces sp. RB6PN25]|uniref:Peptidoglycan-binding protein n=1 Tax=Streptomyces humicola TaxID=2953240 RepID=A0ABT1PQ14_9ACTN|nr:peptidoglycan-binding domain-containing protein [Streptomyces humicola]MCQ4079769.1 peptidoglycan-binding protein [Streptomyces humicola]